ncbi:MAG: cob(I)yrinic acid a,c-diamide adenosyltransferase [Synergistaceae bacterium]|jgi:ATP:cob(I)alamin adenosyltransferase|nr:cob(I)yrinic acid a,c-diamide adenosyltransferase [Synergistaceae bacterium]
MGRVYTRTGDGGTTRLGNNEKVPKDSRRVGLYGVLDEATSALGMARAVSPAPVEAAIRELQAELIKLMTRISLYDPDCPVISASDVEARIESIREIVPMPDVFVEPGESAAGAALHLARAILRRAEREAVTLGREENFNADDLKLVNRMSDYVYALAEWADYEEKVASITRLVVERVGLQKRCVEDVSLDAAETLIVAMKRKAAEVGVPMAMAVCDLAGRLILFARQDGVLPISVDLASKKAFTATQLKCPTSELAKATAPGAMLWGLQANSDLVVFGGGIPLTCGGKVIGAVGVSGGTVDEDVAVAEAALNIWDNIKIKR